MVWAVKMTWKRRYEGETICLWGRNANFRFILVSLDEVWLPTVSFQTGSSERAAEVPALLSLYPDVSLITNFGCKWREDSAHLLTLTDAPLLSSDSPRLTWSLVAVFDPRVLSSSTLGTRLFLIFFERRTSTGSGLFALLGRCFAHWIYQQNVFTRLHTKKTPGNTNLVPPRHIFRKKTWRTSL